MGKILLYKDIIGYLQTILIESVLLCHPLPGSDQPVVFPDLSFVTQAQTVLLADENLFMTESFDQLPFTVEILKSEVLRKRVEEQTEENVAYLRFRQPEAENNIILLTLEVRILSKRHKKSMGLSGMNAKFEKINDKWQLVEEPIFFAT